MVHVARGRGETPGGSWRQGQRASTVLPRGLRLCCCCFGCSAMYTLSCAQVEISDPVGRLRAETEKEKAKENYDGLVLALTLVLAP